MVGLLMKILQKILEEVEDQGMILKITDGNIQELKYLLVVLDFL